LEYEYCVGKAWRSAVSVAYSCHIVVDGQVAIMDSGPGARGGAGRGRRGEVCACGICLNLSAHMRVRVPAPRCPMSEWRPKSPPRASHVSGTPAGKHVVPMIPMGPPHCHCVATASGDLLLLGTSAGTTTFLNVISENLRRNSKICRDRPTARSRLLCQLGAKSPVEGEGEEETQERGFARLTVWWYLHFLSFYSNFTYLQFAPM
jgi:hypothetical protein